MLTCENSRFSSLFAAKDVSRETPPAAKSEEKRLFSCFFSVFLCALCCWRLKLRLLMENYLHIFKHFSGANNFFFSDILKSGV